MGKKNIVLSATTICAVIDEIDKSFNPNDMSSAEIFVVAKIMGILHTMREERSDIRGPIG